MNNGTNTNDKRFTNFIMRSLEKAYLQRKDLMEKVCELHVLFTNILEEFTGEPMNEPPSPMNKFVKKGVFPPEEVEETRFDDSMEE